MPALIDERAFKDPKEMNEGHSQRRIRYVVEGVPWGKEVRKEKPW